MKKWKLYNGGEMACFSVGRLHLNLTHLQLKNVKAEEPGQYSLDWLVNMKNSSMAHRYRHVFTAPSMEKAMGLAETMAVKEMAALSKELISSCAKAECAFNGNDVGGI